MSFITFIFISLITYNFSYDLDENKIKQIDEMINNQMKEAKLKTVGFIITNSTTTLYQNVYGETNGISEKTPFVIGSITKSFTSLALLKLNISLNQTLDNFNLGDYLDEELLKDITVGELLNHTSGLDSFSSRRIADKGNYFYSNYGFGLLGKIIEQKSNEKYSDFVKNEIFKPLNMINSHATYNSAIIDSYDNFLGSCSKYKSLESEYKFNDGFFIPAGYISVPIEDMGYYLRFYLNKDNKQYVSQITEGKVEIGYNIKYGMGMVITNRSDYIKYSHSGVTASFLSQMYIYPEIDIGFFVVINTNDIICGMPTTQFMNNLESLIIYDIYDGIDSSLFFSIHFTIDILIILIIAFPLIYLIITIVRKIKRKKYTWFIGVKGIISFSFDFLVLIILPITILIIFYATHLKYITIFKRDVSFIIVMVTVLLMLNFIIKLIYLILYKKFIEVRGEETDNKVEQISLRYSDEEE